MGLILFTSSVPSKPRWYARLSQCFVSLSEPRATFTNLRLSWKLPLPAPSAMLAPTLSAAQTICLPTVLLANGSQPMTSVHTASASFSASLYTCRFSKLVLSAMIERRWMQGTTDYGQRTTGSTRSPDYFSLAPFGTSSPKVARTGRPPSPTEAATIIPFDSTPRILRAWRLTTTTTFMPTSFSGS